MKASEEDMSADGQEEKRRRVYWMVSQYANRYGLNFKDAVKELVDFSNQLTKRNVKI